MVLQAWVLDNGHRDWSICQHIVAHTPQQDPFDGTKASASHDQRVQLQIFNRLKKLLPCISPVQFCHNVHLFLPGSSVKCIKNFNISSHIILLHDLGLSELCQWNQRRTRLGPELGTRLVERVGVDVDDVKGVTLVKQIVHSPFQRVLAAL